MPLAEDFQQVVDALPPDWTALEVDLRIDDPERFVEAATLLTQVNAMPYSKQEWHWRLRVAAQFHDVVIFDLTAEGIDGPDLLHAMRERGELEEGTPTLGYYSHVDVDTRTRALEAGFTRIVPRSRMAREAVALVEGLVSD